MENITTEQAEKLQNQNEARDLLNRALVQIRLLTGRYGNNSSGPIPSDIADVIFNLAQSTHNLPGVTGPMGFNSAAFLAEARDAVARAESHTRSPGWRMRAYGSHTPDKVSMPKKMKFANAISWGVPIALLVLSSPAVNNGRWDMLQAYVALLILGINTVSSVMTKLERN